LVVPVVLAAPEAPEARNENWLQNTTKTKTAGSINKNEPKLVSKPNPAVAADLVVVQAAQEVVLAAVEALVALEALVVDAVRGDRVVALGQPRNPESKLPWTTLGSTAMSHCTTPMSFEPSFCSSKMRTGKLRWRTSSQPMSKSRLR
jgi:hypothetical protein